MTAADNVQSSNWLDDLTLEELLALAWDADPNTRLELYRDPIARHGLDALIALGPWLTDDRRSAFAIRVIGRIADAGFDREASATLREAMPSMSFATAADADWLLGLPTFSRIHSSSSSTGSPATAHQFERTSVMPARYRAWQDKLAHHFLHQRPPNAPLTLFVDDDLLRTLADDEVVDPARDLAESLTDLGTEPEQMFRRIDGFVTLWQQDRESPPPVLPILAACVLAATWMAADGEVAANNYYRRFRELLSVPGHGAPPGYAESVPYYWELYRHWLSVDRRGDFGVPTAVRHHRLTNIGYAISQALIRRSDRRRFPEFFRWLGTRPGESVSPHTLVQWFAIWIGRRGASATLEHALRDAAFRNVLGEVLAEALREWDGGERDHTGRIVLTVRLVLENALGRPAAWLEAPADPSISSVTLRDSREYVVSGGPTGYLGRLDRDVEPWEAFQEGFRLTGGRFTAQLRPSPVLPFRIDPALGQWVSASYLSTGERMVLIASDDAADTVEDFLGKYGQSGWSRRSGAFGSERFFSFVQVEFAELPTTWPQPSIAELLPSNRLHIAMVGGLPVLGTSRVYLTGGAPDLQAPSEGTLQVTVDGDEYALPEDGIFHLNQLNLGEGPHFIGMAGSRLQFDLVGTVGDAPRNCGDADYSIRLQSRTPAQPSGPTHAPERMFAVAYSLQGALLVGGPRIDPTTVAILPQSARLGWILGNRPGEIVAFTRPSVFRWLTILGLSAGPLDLLAPFPIAWMIFKSRLSGWTVAAGPALSSPGSAIDRPADVSEWKRIVTRFTAEGLAANLDQWSAYIRSAESC